MNKAIFLDRDGVINKVTLRDGKPYPPDSIESLEILPGVLDGLKALHHSGWLLIVVTNQPDVARGSKTILEVESINQYLTDHLPIDKFYTCYHDDLDNCHCRKPQPGLIFSAAKTYDIDLSSSFIIGDRWRDIEAGYQAGCKCIFIDYRYNERQPEQFDHKVIRFEEAVNIILGK